MQERTLRRSDSCLLDSGVGESGEVELPSCCEPQVQCQRVAQNGPGQILVCSNTIKQHYYPEGGWGWLIVVCAVVVQCLNHGIQLSWGIIELEVRKKFVKATLTDTGVYVTADLRK